MRKLTINLTLLVLMLLTVAPIMAQKDIVMSQYMHNRYALNTAFAGNREVLSLYGGYRKKWAGFEGAPGTMLFSMHSALKNENVALGFEVYNQQYGVNKETGFTFSYTYRIKLANHQKLAFSINGGGGFYNANWTDVATLGGASGQLDNVFANNESNFAPMIGFGAAWYSNRFFAGFSIPNFFYYDPYIEGGSNSFALNKADYLATAGYLFEMADRWHLQPSFMARINPEFGSSLDLNASVIYDNMIWVGAAYRTTKDIVAMLAYQVTPQLRFSYSLDYTTGEISSFNNGTHEIAIQYDFGYKVKTPNPKFF
ncbi:type IX secretion system membrane protein PorP/SprF [Carboxylicivirga mesophila]|uniref:Type IX secretion system membrane protein PorP/SprF n=1 Tax=Carboxylicivirga mesophila TaxID=1166478 RepID=A0ABS5K9W0_9BACT|nr:type IX secretion system membrane protein PorP/SprF [Carboxylicivirga mesophila]MBS2211667.1 type IX secretion system membrane protein PorP/SprF [Carboxylicivirga mesophila]